MFGVKADDSKLLKAVFTAISTVVDEATFEVSEKGMQLRAMGPARVSMIDFFIPKTFFNEYNASEDMKICLDVGELLKLLKRARRDETVELSLDDETARLNVVITGRYRRAFSMPTLETFEDKVPLPNVTFKAKATLTANGLRQALNDVALVSDYIQIETDGENLIMKGKGQLTEANIRIQKDSEPILSLDVKEPSKSTFSLSYLTDIVKAAQATSEVVSIEFSTGMPIRMDFKQQQNGKLEYYLAPRIEID